MLRSVLCLFVLLVASSGKRCCDQHCKRPISYGRTTQRHIADPHAMGDAKFLSFAQGSLVQVFAKEVMGDKEYWEAEVSGRRGLVPRDSISEQHIVCQAPQFTLEDPQELAPPPRETLDTFQTQDSDQPRGEDTQDGSPVEHGDQRGHEDVWDRSSTWDGDQGTHGYGRDRSVQENAQDSDRSVQENAQDSDRSVQENAQDSDRSVQENAQDSVATSEGHGDPRVPEGMQGGVTREDSRPPVVEDRQEHATEDRDIPPTEAGSPANTNVQEDNAEMDNSPQDVSAIIKEEPPSEAGEVRDNGRPLPEPSLPFAQSGTQSYLKESTGMQRDDSSANRASWEGHTVVAEQVVVNSAGMLGLANTAPGFGSHGTPGGMGLPETGHSYESRQFGGDGGKPSAGEQTGTGDNDGTSEVDEMEEEDKEEEDNGEEGGEKEVEAKDDGGEAQQGDEHQPNVSEQNGSWGRRHQDEGVQHQDEGVQHQDEGVQHQDEGVQHQDGGVHHYDGGKHQVVDEYHQDDSKQHLDGSEHRQDGGDYHRDENRQHPDGSEHLEGGGGDEEGRESGQVLDKDLGHSGIGKSEKQAELEEVLSIPSTLHSSDSPPPVAEMEETPPALPTDADSSDLSLLPPVGHQEGGWDTLASEEDVQPTEVLKEVWQSAPPVLPQESASAEHIGGMADDGLPVQEGSVEGDSNQHPPPNLLQGEDPTHQPTAPSTDTQFNPIRNTWAPPPAPPSDSPTSPPNEWVELGQPTVELRRKAVGERPTEEPVDAGFHSRRMAEVVEDDLEAPPEEQLLDEDSLEHQSLSEQLLLYLPNALKGVLEAQLGPGGVVGMLYGVVGTLVALVVPSCLLCCQSCSSRRKHTQAIRQHKVSKQQLQTQLDATSKEKGELGERLKAEQTQRSSAEQQRAQLQQTVAGLENERGSLMDHISGLNRALTEVKGELQTSQENGSQLAAMLTQEQTRSQGLESQVSSLGQEVTAASSNQQRSEGQVAELEAAKDQMEQDLFNSQQALQTLQQSERKLTDQCDTLQHSVQSVSSELEEAQREVFHLRQAVQDKDMEMEMLRNCLRQLTPEEGEGEGKQEEDEEGSTGTEQAAQLHQSRVEKIHAMLDTSKAQLELKGVRDERDRLDRQLQLERDARQSLEGEVQRLEQELQTLSVERDAMALQHQQALSKLQTLTEYFEGKEKNLHRQLGREEMARQEMEGREASAKELVVAAEEERTREKEELKELRKQMAEIEKSMTEQLFTNQQRAQEAYSQLKRREQELRIANKEITALKQSLDEAEAQIAALSRPRTPPRFPPFGRPPPLHGRLSMDDFDGPPRPMGAPPLHAMHRPPSVGPLPQDQHPPRVPRPRSTQPRTSSPGGPEEDLSVSHVSAPGSGGPPSRSRSPNSIAGEIPPRNPSGRMSMPEFMDQPPVGPRSGPAYPAGIYRGPPPGAPRGEYPPYSLVARQPPGRGSLPPAPFGPPPRSRGPPPTTYPPPHALSSVSPIPGKPDDFVRAPPISSLPRQPGPPPLYRPEGMMPSPPRDRRPPPPDQMGRPPFRDGYPPPDQTGRPPFRDGYPPPDQTGRPPIRDGYPPPGGGMLPPRPPMEGPAPPHLQASSSGATAEQGIQPRNV